MKKKTVWIALLCIALAAPAPGQEQAGSNQLAREIFQQLIEINTTDSVGNVTTAAEAMAARLLSAGFPAKDVIVAGPNDRKKNLLARLRGTGRRKPLLFLAHLDVVEARREDWTTDPFQFVEKDGYFYGRGTVDIKDGDAILVANFIRLKKEGFTPDRDLILALTADEEGGTANGVDWLLKHHRDWVDAEYCINLDGGDFMSKNGKKIYGAIQASEKVYVDFQLEAKNPGGHSSRPSRENAIYQLAAALSKLEKFSFPVELNEITRSMLEKTAEIEGGPLAADMKAASQPHPDEAAIRSARHGSKQDQANPGNRDRRSEDQRDFRRAARRRRQLDSARARAAFPTSTRCDESRRGLRQSHLGQTADPARDGYRRFRRPLFARRGNSYLWRRRCIPRPRQPPRSWSG